MNKRANYIYELLGRITSKKLRIDKNKNPFYRLEVNIKNNQKVNAINAFSDDLKEKGIWQEIEQSNYHGKEYLFFCRNYMGIYSLKDWKEIK